ncbi:NfeD family protein [Synechocystis sp. PCC 7509]|uniref:NfeD family protein n=1 Tax=Synechocystis sp. PCC 7509 TaxID=927677 RepID=UPI0002AC364D|nr:NfeD family protein [Synechocystis sp. PCC 7509]
MFITYTLVWLIAGAVLCLLELFLPTAFVAFMMGISALIVGLVSVLIPQLSLQIILWLGLSTSFVLLSRRFMPKAKQSRKFQDAVFAETLTAIAPGKEGRVIYEGNSWRARCEDRDNAIAPYEKVYVVRREGTLLIVIPENVLDS